MNPFFGHSPPESGRWLGNWRLAPSSAIACSAVVIDLPKVFITTTPLNCIGDIALLNAIPARPTP
ncbi:MAG: hypothetical protein H6914_00975 [Novosphingobium sp.]|nr:hypothetical protein [Novosphingobium sp.]